MAQQEVQNGGAEKIAEAVAFTAVKPQLLVEAPKASDAVQFYKAAFGAEESRRTMHPKRKAEQELPLVLSAELKLAGSTILVSDLADDLASPAKPAGSGGMVICLETQDVDAAVEKAVAAGAVAEGEILEGEGRAAVGAWARSRTPTDTSGSSATQPSSLPTWKPRAHPI